MTITYPSVYVAEYLTGAKTHKAGQTQACCSECGTIGPVCDYYADAEAIAVAHAKTHNTE